MIVIQNCIDVRGYDASSELSMHYLYHLINSGCLSSTYGPMYAVWPPSTSSQGV